MEYFEEVKFCRFDLGELADIETRIANKLPDCQQAALFGDKIMYSINVVIQHCCIIHNE